MVDMLNVKKLYYYFSFNSLELRKYLQLIIVLQKNPSNIGLHGLCI